MFCTRRNTFGSSGGSKLSQPQEHFDPQLDTHIISRKCTPQTLKSLHAFVVFAVQTARKKKGRRFTASPLLVPHQVFEVVRVPSNRSLAGSFPVEPALLLPGSPDGFGFAYTTLFALGDEPATPTNHSQNPALGHFLTKALEQTFLRLTFSQPDRHAIPPPPLPQNRPKSQRFHKFPIA